MKMKIMLVVCQFIKKFNFIARKVQYNCYNVNKYRIQRVKECQLFKFYYHSFKSLYILLPEV